MGVDRFSSSFLRRPVAAAIAFLIAATGLLLTPHRAEAHSYVNNAYFSGISSSVSPSVAKTGTTIEQTITYSQKFAGTATVFAVDDSTGANLWCAAGPNAAAGATSSVGGSFVAPAGESTHQVHGYVVFGASCYGAFHGYADAPLTIDNTAPETYIGSGPSGTSSSTGATFTFYASEAATFACSLDGGAFASCTSPKAYGSLADGQHAFQVTATDNAGNTDPIPASRNWTVDTGAPALAFVGATNPINAGNQSGVSASGTTQAGASVLVELSDLVTTVSSSTIALGDGTWSVSGLDASSLLDGDVTYTATATGGNSQQSSATFSAVKDVAAPAAPVIDTPAEDDTSTVAIVTVSGSAEAGTTVSVIEAGDEIGSATVAGDGTWSTDIAFVDGGHAISAKATDDAGNEGAESAARTFLVDTADHTAPETSIESGPASRTNQQDATFEFSSSEEGSTFSCSLDGAPAATCESPATYTGLAAGNHSFAVAATDASGNTDASPATANWTVDITAPDTTITSGPSGRVPSDSAAFEFTSTESPATFECSLDNADFETCTSPKSYSTLPEGDHNFRVRATDEAGNTDDTPAVRNWTTDAETTESSYDSFNVAPDGKGYTSPRSLEAGRVYRIEVRGLYQYKAPTATAPTTLADAECATAPFLGGQFEARRYVDSSSNDWYDLYVNNQQVTWSPAPGTDMASLPGSPASAGCSRTHTYSIFVTGTGAAFSLRTFDPASQDNRGQFFVNVYRQD